MQMWRMWAFGHVRTVKLQISLPIHTNKEIWTFRKNYRDTACMHLKCTYPKMRKYNIFPLTDAVVTKLWTLSQCSSSRIWPTDKIDEINPDIVNKMTAKLAIRTIKTHVSEGAHNACFPLELFTSQLYYSFGHSAATLSVFRNVYERQRWLEFHDKPFTAYIRLLSYYKQLASEYR